MTFLIAQILLLLALAAIFGGAIVYWGFRRHFVDVSAEYGSYRRTLSEVSILRREKTAAETRVAALEAD